MRKADAADERARAAESPRAEANKAAAGDCGAQASAAAGRAGGGQPESGRRQGTAARKMYISSGEYRCKEKPEKDGLPSFSMNGGNAT